MQQSAQSHRLDKRDTELNWVEIRHIIWYLRDGPALESSLKGKKRLLTVQWHSIIEHFRLSSLIDCKETNLPKSYSNLPCLQQLLCQGSTDPGNSVMVKGQSQNLEWPIVHREPCSFPMEKDHLLRIGSHHDPDLGHENRDPAGHHSPLLTLSSIGPMIYQIYLLSHALYLSPILKASAHHITYT